MGAKINSTSQWMDRTEQINLTSLFEKMNADEQEQYAKTGDLPEWFRRTAGAILLESQEDERSA
jgi:hypothetical protein